MSKFKAYNTGGSLTKIGATAANFIPGYGPAISAGISLVGGLLNRGNKPRERSATNYASHGYRKGGKLKYPLGGSLSAAQPIGPDAVRFDGPSHEQGGIPIDSQGMPNEQNPIAEVEGGETRQGDYIFSDELMVPESDMTFAEMHELLLQQGADEQQIEQLAQMQEQVRGEQGDVPTQTIMKKGGNLPKYGYGGTTARVGLELMENNMSQEEGSSRDWTATAQRLLPSATRLASAAFAPKPKRTPGLRAERTEFNRQPFTNAQRNLAGGFRAASTQGNAQGAYAQYTQATNDLASQESQAESQLDFRNNQNQMRADQFNIQTAMRDNEAQAQDTAGRIGLVDQAIQAPLTAAVADKRGKEQMIANILVSGDQTQNPTDRMASYRVKLRAIGISDDEIERILSAYQMKYGGKIKKFKKVG